MSEFQYETGRRQVFVGPSWLSMFTSTLAALLVAGVIMFLAVRFYVYWSINDAIRQVDEKIHSGKK